MIDPKELPAKLREQAQLELNIAQFRAGLEPPTGDEPEAINADYLKAAADFIEQHTQPVTDAKIAEIEARQETRICMGMVKGDVNKMEGDIDDLLIAYRREAARADAAESRIQQIIAPVEVGGGIVQDLNTRIAELELQLEQGKEAIQKLNAGKPLGSIIGSHTILNQERRIQKLSTRIAELEAEQNEHNRSCVCQVWPKVDAYGREIGGSHLLECCYHKAIRTERDQLRAKLDAAMELKKFASHAAFCPASTPLDYRTIYGGDKYHCKCGLDTALKRMEV